MLASFISIFPQSIKSMLNVSIIEKAIARGLLKINEIPIQNINLNNKHKNGADDLSFGGGAGQIIKIDKVVSAIRKCKPGYVILTDPRGKQFTKKEAIRLANYEHLIFICGKYAGIDSRIKHYIDTSLSIGDFILTGGELAALIILDATVRHIPGMVGNPDSLIEEIANNKINTCKQYTKPLYFEGYSVPKILLDGNHLAVKKFKEK